MLFQASVEMTEREKELPHGGRNVWKKRDQKPIPIDQKLGVPMRLQGEDKRREQRTLRREKNRSLVAVSMDEFDAW